MINIARAQWVLIAFASACVLLAIPLWCVATPGMPDYPAHLASFYLIGGEPSKYYRIEWAFLPNLASELIVPPAGHLMPLDVAGKLFLTTIVVLWVLGPAAVQRALYGKVGLGAFLAAAFTYNANFVWGFINYAFAAGVSFFVFAAWIATDGRRRPLHLAGFAAAFTAVYFLHLLALAGLAVMVGSFEFSVHLVAKNVSVRRLAIRLATVVALFAPAAFFFLFLKPSGNDSSIQFDLLHTIVGGFASAIRFNFGRSAWIVTSALLLLFSIGAWKRRIAIDRRMIPVLAALTLCTLFAPESAAGGWGIFLRLPAVLGAITFASSDFKLSPRLTGIAVGAATVLFALQSVTLASDWRGVDLRFGEFRAALGQLKPQLRLLTVVDGEPSGDAVDQKLWHISEFAVIDRGALTSLLFTTTGQHVIRVNPPMDRFTAANGPQGIPPFISDLNALASGNLHDRRTVKRLFYLKFFQCHYDQAVVLHGDNARPQLPTMLRLRWSGSFFGIYDIIPDGRCTGR